MTASKCMHNFPPRLSCFATLLDNTFANEQARCFPLGGWLKKWSDQLTIDKFQYFLKVQVVTDVCDAPSWLNTRLPTRPHSPQYAQFMNCHSLDAWQSNWCLCFLGSFWRLCSFHLLTWNSFSNFYTVYPLRRYKFLLKIRSSSLNGMFTNTAVSCENTSFPLPWKIAK